MSSSQTWWRSSKTLKINRIKESRGLTSVGHCYFWLIRDNFSNESCKNCIPYKIKSNI